VKRNGLADFTSGWTARVCPIFMRNGLVRTIVALGRCRDVSPTSTGRQRQSHQSAKPTTCKRDCACQIYLRLGVRDVSTRHLNSGIGFVVPCANAVGNVSLRASPLRFSADHRTSARRHPTRSTSQPGEDSFPQVHSFALAASPQPRFPDQNSCPGLRPISLRPVAPHPRRFPVAPPPGPDESCSRVFIWR